MHDSIQKAVECVKNGTCTQEAKNVMTYFESAQQASRVVMQTLDALLQEKRSEKQSD